MSAIPHSDRHHRGIRAGQQGDTAEADSQALELKIELKGSLWMSVGERSFGGHGRVELLGLVAELGSIARAAKAMKMSYKAAWDAIDQMNALAGERLVERTTGGRGGGSTRLTERGRQLIANFRLIEQEHQRFVEQLSSQAQGLVEDLILFRRLSIKTSARNQFHGTVTAIKAGAVNDEIDIEVPGGEGLVATITSESTRCLGLTVGAEVFALIKAPSVMIMAPDAGLRLSARNQLAGKVSRLHPGVVNADVVIELPGGLAITAIVTNESVAKLGLEVGAAAIAVFKASSVIIGIPA